MTVYAEEIQCAIDELDRLIERVIPELETGYHPADKEVGHMQQARYRLTELRAHFDEARESIPWSSSSGTC